MNSLVIVFMSRLIFVHLFDIYLKAFIVMCLRRKVGSFSAWPKNVFYRGFS